MTDLLQEYKNAIAVWRRLDAEADRLRAISDAAYHAAEEACSQACGACDAMEKARRAFEESIK